MANTKKKKDTKPKAYDGTGDYTYVRPGTIADPAHGAEAPPAPAGRSTGGGLDALAALLGTIIGGAGQQVGGAVSNPSGGAGGLGGLLAGLGRRVGAQVGTGVAGAPFGAVAGMQQQAGQTLLDQTINELVGGGQQIDRSAALAPFDQAQAQLPQIAGLARNEINDAEADLLRNLGVLDEAYGRSAVGHQANIQQTGQQALSGFQNDLAPVLADMAAQGVAAPDINAQAALQKQSLVGDNARQVQLSQQMAALRDFDSQDRRATAENVTNSALGQLQINETQALQDILSQRAGVESGLAQQQFAQDQQQADRRIGVAQDVLGLQGQLSEQNAGRSRAEVETEIQNYSRTKGPKAPAAFYDLTSGAANVNEALVRLNEADSLGELAQAGLQRDVLEQWIRRYFDEGGTSGGPAEVQELRRLLGLA